MVKRTPAWPRSRFAPGGAPGRAQFLVFSARPFPTPEDGTMPMDFLDWCPFDGWPPGFAWGYRRRADSAALFARMEAGAELGLQAPSSGMTPALLEALRRAQLGATISGQWQDAPDLGGLQFAWAMVRWLLASGAEVVLDLESTRWWGRDELLSWQPDGWVGHAFVLEREVLISTLPQPGEARWTIATRGMGKFGRPELRLTVESEEADVHAEERVATLPPASREAVVQLATELALGALPDPEFRFGGQRFALHATEPALLELRPR